MVRSRIAAFSVFLVVGLACLGSPASAQTVVLRATLTGAEAGPGPGDPDGWGVAQVMIDDRTNRVCTLIWVRDIAPATGAHIHFGAAGETGGHAIDVVPPASRYSYTCTTASESIVQQLIAGPSGFYVNIHNAEFHDGAIRGQLQAV